MLAISALVLVNIIGTLVAVEYTAVVETTSGPIKGEILTTTPHPVSYASFKGIQYAKAPTGYLRFQPPVPVDPWTETLTANTEGSVCSQPHMVTYTAIGSENCLFLNVFTPVINVGDAAPQSKSVMVWFHGGVWNFGSGSTINHQPDYLLEKDVIFVSVNYRLGVLGFLNLNHRNATGNAGLKDQKLALQWVQDNIGKFGGDPQSVTIIGPSVGGASVFYHMISQASRALFNRAIAMSGTPLCPWTFQTDLEALSTAQQLAKHFGTVSTNKETLLKALYDATPKQLLLATISIRLISTFAPTVENPNLTEQPFLTESPYRSYYTKNYKKVPLILGFMGREMLKFADKPAMFSDIVDIGLKQAEIIGRKPHKSLNIIRDLIISDKFLDSVDATDLQAAIDITSTVLFNAPIDRTQKFLAANNDNNPVYYYRTSFYPPDQSAHKYQGPAHMDDDAYIFYKTPAENSGASNAAVNITIERITTMWTNFAKHGNPSRDSSDNLVVGVDWPDSTLCGNALDIGDELTVISRPTNEDDELLELLSWPDEKKSLAIPNSLV